MGFKDGRLTRRQAVKVYIALGIAVLLLAVLVIPNL